MTNPYKVLQVDPSADPVVIRAAFRALARVYHPDFGGDPVRMVAINGAWAILGNDSRRAAHDAAARARAPQPPIVVGGPGHSDYERGPVSTRSPVSSRAGAVLDFGRYVGWSVGELAEHDPDYLEWLARTPAGRHLATEIGTCLARRAPVATATPPPSRGRRSRW